MYYRSKFHCNIPTGLKVRLGRRLMSSLTNFLGMYIPIINYKKRITRTRRMNMININMYYLTISSHKFIGASQFLIK